MRILWITNTIFPEPSKALGLSVPIFGGWMYGLADQLLDGKDVALAVATVYDGGELLCMDIDNVIYYLLPCKHSLGYRKGLEELWKYVVSDYKPDVVHIHGTEYQHGLACIRACPDQSYVVSVQGLVGVYSRYYYAGISYYDIIRNITVRDLLRLDSVFHGKRKYKKRGEYEKEYIVASNHIVGRTEWDYAHIRSINSGVSYHYCNEILRSGFYGSEKWNLNSIKKYKIFLSQASYPIKGTHQVLKAVALIINNFPEITIRIAGDNELRRSSIKNCFKRSGYVSYLEKKIEHYGLSGCVEYTGPLSEEEMIKEYLTSHIYICPSSIENSPNSVGESQMLGVPTIASFVGGVPDMVIHKETGLLYRYEEVEMLAEYIKMLFVNSELAKKISKQSIASAEKRHDRKINCSQMLRIYSIVHS